MALKINNPARNVVTDAITGQFSGGVLRIYDGTQPGTAGATSGSSLLIVEIGSLYWAAASNGTALLASSAGTTGTSGTAGTAAWARLIDSGTSCIIDGACGTGVSNNFVIDSAVILGGSVVTLTKADIIEPAE